MQLLTQSVVNLSGTAIFAIVNLAIGISMARLLSPTGLGQYALVLSAVSALSYTSTLSLGQAGIYFINNQRKPVELVTTHIFKWQRIAAIGLAGAIFGMLHYESYFGSVPRAAMAMMGVYGACLLLIGTLNQILVAFLHMKRFVAVRLTPSLVLLCLILLSWQLSELTVTRAWIFMALGQLAGAALVLYLVRDWIALRTPFAWNEMKPMLSFGAKLSVAQMIHLLHGELAILLLGFFSTDFEQLGFYRASIRLSGILLLVAGSLTPLLYSRWASSTEEQRRSQAERVSRCFWLFIVFGVGALELLADRIIPLIYGAEYAPAIEVFRIVILGVGARFLLAPFLQVFAGGGRPIFTTVVLGISVAVMAVLIALLTDERAAFGAAVSFAIASALALVLGYLVASIAFGVRIRHCFFVTRADLHYLAGLLRRGSAPAAEG